MALTSALVLASVSSSAQPAALEYDVKAAFLLNFARYVAWPAAEQQRPFKLCVLGTSPFGSRLDAVMAGEVWHGFLISVSSVRDAREAIDCHMLYVPASATDRFVSSVSQVARQPVLTVGETREFLRRGGIIQLFLENNKVRFSINQRAAATTGLQISSRILRLAREVVTEASPAE